MSKNTKSKGQPKPQHVFRRIRDPMVSNAASSSPSPVSLVSDATGNGSLTYTLSPLGIKGLSGSVTGSVVGFDTALFYSPYFPFLYNQARNFERYRILNATLIVVGNVGSTATGRIIVDSSTDMADNTSPVTIGTSTGGIVFDLASLATRDKRIQLDVDTSWKKVSAQTFNIVNGLGTALAVSSGNDLSFTSIYISLVAATQAGSLGVFTAANFFLEYDVEFRDPISYGVNV